MESEVSASARASCKAIKTPQGDFFLLVTWSDSTFDVRLTDMQQGWRQLGVRAPENHSFRPKEWLQHAKEALYDPEPPRQFEFEAEAEGNCMRLGWTAEYEEGRSYVCECTLQATANTAALLVSMMSHLCSSYKVLKGAISEMDRHNAALKNLVESTQSQLKAQIDAGKDREADLFIKFTAVLNSKKDSIRQLTSQLAAAQAEVERLTQRLEEEQVQGEDAAGEASTDIEEEGAKDEEAIGYEGPSTSSLNRSESDQRATAQAIPASGQLAHGDQPVQLAPSEATQATAMQVDGAAEGPQAANPTQEDLLSELGF